MRNIESAMENLENFVPIQTSANQKTHISQSFYFSYFQRNIEFFELEKNDIIFVNNDE